MAGIIKQAIMPDGKLHLSGLFDRYTGTPIAFKETSEISTDSEADGIVYKKFGGKYVKREVTSISLKSFGAISDADIVNFTGTDNKLAIQKAFAVCAKANIKLIIEGNFASTPITINADGLVVDFVAGSNIVGYTTSGANDRLIIFGVNAKNITINAYGSYVRCPVFGTGEQRHNVQLSGCYNININGLECINGGGDGFYIGNGTLPLPENITLTDCKTNGCRRNGISLVNGINITLIRPNCKNSVGTLPKAGIDVEPNIMADSQLRGIKIIDPNTSGNGGYGILLALGAVGYLNENTVDILVSNHVSNLDGSAGSRGGFGIVGTGYSNPWNFKMNGSIKYNGVVKNCGGAGFVLNSMNPLFTPKIKVDIDVENAGCVTPVVRDKFGASIFSGTGANFPTGNLDLNLKVADTRATPVHYAALYLESSYQPIKDFNANITWDGRSTTGKPLFQEIANACIGNVNVLNNNIIDAAASLVANYSQAYSGCVVNFTAGATFYLPIVANVIGQVFGIKSSTASPVMLAPSTGDKILFNKSNQTSPLLLSNIGEFISVKATLDGWVVVNTNFKGRFLFTGGQPSKDIFHGTAAPVDGTWERGARIININSANQGVDGWTCIGAGTPGTWLPFGLISADIGKLKYGITANRPLASDPGFQYFDTTLGKPIFFKSAGVWVDGTGTTV